MTVHAKGMLTGLALPALFGLAAAYGSVIPEVEIGRDDTAHEWPFAVDRGTLVCIEISKQRTVLFSEPWRDDVPQELGNMTLPRNVVVSTNPFALLASVENRDLYLPFDSLETLIVRLSPFEQMGFRLCEEDEASRRKTP